MSRDPRIKGWCPGALRPMMSGDGLVVRVRPFGGRLTQAQATGIAALARANGNGLLDVSSRGNIQMRGITEANHAAVLDGLQALALLDASAEAEGRRNILVTPFWTEGDETRQIAAAVTQALTSDSAPDLPQKFGVAVDTGVAPVLRTASADIRIERDTDGRLVLTADGASIGRPITVKTAAQELLALADWFVENRAEEKRMRALLQRRGGLPQGHVARGVPQTYQPQPAVTEQGALVGVAFGQMHADTLETLASQGALRMTPWRMLLVEAAQDLPAIEGVITDPADPLLNVTACTGAPGCTQAHVETRPLARDLAARLVVGQALHVSGCAKGCAHPKAAPLTITGTPNGLSLIHNGRASDPATQTGLTAAQLTKAI